MAAETRITVMSEAELEKRIDRGLVEVAYKVSLEIPERPAAKTKMAAAGGAVRGQKKTKKTKKKVDCYVTSDDEVICIAH